MGLSEEAGTGAPGPQAILYEATERLEPIEKKLFNGKRKTIAQIQVAKLKRDRLVLEELPMGASRFGGVPDLPPGAPWPTYKGRKIPFLAQVDLSAVKADKAPLPPDGWLYAFGLFDNDKSRRPSPVSVFHHRGPASKLVRAKQPSEGDIWPDWGNKRVYEVVPIRTDSKSKPGRKQNEPDRTAGWLLGEMSGVFGTAGEQADYAMLDGDDWINVLAIKSVGSMQWSDVGHLYLLARRSRIEKGDFSQVLGAVCSG
jgi:hypothetical protein